MKQTNQIRKGRLLFVLAATISIFFACSRNSLNQPVAAENSEVAENSNLFSSSTKTVSKTFPVQPFSKLLLSSEGNIQITQGNTESVSVEADNDRLISLITIQNSGDTLIVKQTPGAGSAGPFTTFIVRITLKSVSYIQHIGSGGIGDVSTTNTLLLPAFTLDWFTTGKERGIFSVSAPAMSAAISGGLVNNFQDGISTVYFYKSKIKRVRLTRYGYGTFDGFYHTISGGFGNASLDAESLEVTNKATSMYAYGDAFVKASKKLSLTNVGSGTIYYTGSAAIVKKQNSGGGSIRQF